MALTLFAHTCKCMHPHMHTQFGNINSTSLILMFADIKSTPLLLLELSENSQLLPQEAMRHCIKKIGLGFRYCWVLENFISYKLKCPICFPKCKQGQSSHTFVRITLGNILIAKYLAP